MAFVLSFVISPGLASADEVRIREYFADIPEMIDIARCESNFRQYTDAGNVLQGGAGGKMIGIFQLHSDYHVTPAVSMGLDIRTLDGNLAYARHLYEREGLAPWKPCLGAVTTSSGINTPVVELASVVVDQERELLIKKIEELQMQVYLLQIKLLQLQLESLSIS